MSVCGIDPGAGGAFALVDDQGELQFVRDMPVIMLDGKRRVVGSAVKEILDEWKPRIVVIERGISISQQSAAGSFNFGVACGILEGVCAGMGMPTTMVYPITWKKMMGVTGDKGGCRLTASRLWPHKHKLFARAKDDGRAEASLVAMYQIMQWRAVA